MHWLWDPKNRHWINDYWYFSFISTLDVQLKPKCLTAHCGVLANKASSVRRRSTAGGSQTGVKCASFINVIAGLRRTSETTVQIHDSSRSLALASSDVSQRSHVVTCGLLVTDTFKHRNLCKCSPKRIPGMEIMSTWFILSHAKKRWENLNNAHNAPGAFLRETKKMLQQTTNIPTCIVDEEVQSGFRFQEVFGKAANGLQTSQVQLHEHHPTAAALLRGVTRRISTELTGRFKIKELRVRFWKARVATSHF